MRILAIETSCDETALAAVEASGNLRWPKFKILENLIASQIKIHRPFGGVVPNLAKREHLKNLPILYNRLIASRYWLPPDLIAVTVGPGLEPALWTGINFARELYKQLKNKNKKLKLLGINHLEGHLYSNVLENNEINKKEKIFPAVALVASGGHTSLLLMKDLERYKKLGETRDDAAGESFDKVARLLDLPYPGGPEIERLAKEGDPTVVAFPRPMLHQENYDFSFSGLKTSVLYYLRDHKNFKKADIAASFQQAAFDVLIAKTFKAAKEFGSKTIMISGGVAANKTLQKEFKKAIKSNSSSVTYKLLVTRYPTDNAAMIAVAAYLNYLRGKKYRLFANGNLQL